MLRIALAVLVLVGAGAIVASYTVLSSFLESMVAESLQENMSLQGEPEVELRSKFPPRMLVGAFAGGHLETGDFDLGDLRPERMEIDLDPFDVDVVGSLTSGSIKTEEPLSGTMRMELSEASVREIARSRIEQFPVRDVQLEAGGATVSSEVDVLGVTIPVSVEGGLDVNDGALVFEPRVVRAFDTTLPESLADALLGGTDFVYPIEGLPYDTQITAVEARKDRLLLSGEVENILAGSSGG